jgi:hypothetical protein
MSRLPVMIDVVYIPLSAPIRRAARQRRLMGNLKRSYAVIWVRWYTNDEQLGHGMLLGNEAGGHADTNAAGEVTA